MKRHQNQAVDSRATKSFWLAPTSRKWSATNGGQSVITPGPKRQMAFQDDDLRTKNGARAARASTYLYIHTCSPDLRDVDHVFFEASIIFNHLKSQPLFNQHHERPTTAVLAAMTEIEEPTLGLCLAQWLWWWMVMVDARVIFFWDTVKNSAFIGFLSDLRSFDGLLQDIQSGLEKAFLTQQNREK